MAIQWYDWCGYVGVLLILGAFFLLQSQRLQPHGWIYQWMNVIGPVGVMLSLVFGERNWPAFLLELAWAAIGIYGIAFSRRKRNEERQRSGRV